MRLVKHQALVGAIAACALLLAGCGGSNSADRTVAKVGNEEVTHDDLLKQMEVLPVMTGASPQGQPQFSQAGNVALAALIRNLIVLDYAKSKDMLPSDADITKEIERLKARNPNFLNELKAQGRTVNDLREQLRVELARFRMLEATLEEGEKVTDQQIQETYDRLKNVPAVQGQQPEPGFLTPARTRLMIIVTGNDQKRRQAEDELKRGVAFEAVSKKYSDYPQIANNPNGPGYYGDLTDDQIQQLFGSQAAKVKGTAVGKTTGWMKINTVGPDQVTPTQEWVNVLVKTRNPSSQAKLDDALKTEIRRRLVVARADNAKVNKDLDDHRKKVKISVDREPYKRFFKEMEDQERAQQAAAAANGQPGAAGAAGTASTATPAGAGR